MIGNSITDTKRVMEIELDTERYGFGVNDYLSEGWILLLVYAESTDSDHGPAQKPVCVLGWPKDVDPPSDIAKAEAQERAARMREIVRRANHSEAD